MSGSTDAYARHGGFNTAMLEHVYLGRSSVDDHIEPAGEAAIAEAAAKSGRGDADRGARNDRVRARYLLTRLLADDLRLYASAVSRGR
jgi:hypothetical protein